MKKLVSFVLCFCVLLCFSSCSNTTVMGNTHETLPDGSNSTKNPSGQTEWFMNSIPFTMDFGGTETIFSDIGYVEVYENHGYTTWFVISIDRTNLSDDDIYWITKPGVALHKDLSVSMSSVNIDGSNVDVESLNYIGKTYDDTYLHYVFCTELLRYSSIGNDFSCFVTYSPESITNPEGISYYYKFNLVENLRGDGQTPISETAAKAMNQVIR